MRKFWNPSYLMCLVSAVMLSSLMVMGTAPVLADNARPDFTVVLDAGHGGHDVGAVDNGAREKDINLGVAKKVAALVKKKMKDARVVMTRDDDTFVSLQERANIANRNRANLFVSIHTNSVDKSNPNRKTVAGASVYALGLHKDQNNLNVARRENSVIELESDYKQKYSGFDPSKDESYIIFEMAQKKNLGNSLRFANAAQKQLVSVAGRKDRGVKQAGFWVLWATTMPSVLIELDFICNPETAAFISSEKGQEKLAEAIFNAIRDYAGGHPAQTAQKSSAAPEPPVAVLEKAPGNSHVDSGVLVASASSRKTEAPEYVPTAGAAPASRARKRRSESSRRFSEARKVETENIPLSSETRYIARAEEVSGDADADMTVAKETSSDSRKDKKKKKQKSKKPAASKSSGKAKASDGKAKDAGKSAGKKEPYKKTILVASNGQMQNVDDSRGVRKITRTLYKIQILASAEKVDKDSPCFCGLSPVECFQENGLYKYTYGESTSRADIEEMLSNVKSRIPDAFIIVSRK